MEDALGNDVPIHHLRTLTKVVKRGLSSYYLHGKDIEVYLINIKDIQNGKVNTGTIERVFVRETPLLEKSRILPGDILITIKGLSFKAAVADESASGFVISANLIALTLSDEIRPEIVAAYINSSIGQSSLMSMAGGGVIKGLNTKSLLEFSIPVPPLIRQEKLSRFLLLVQEYNDLLREELGSRNRLTDALIAQIMR